MLQPERRPGRILLEVEGPAAANTGQKSELASSSSGEVLMERLVLVTSSTSETLHQVEFPHLLLSPMATV